MMVTAIYPGSFDPITKGHIDVLNKAAKIFDKVIIAVSINYSKKSMFSIEERVDMIKKSIEGFDNVEVDSFSGLTAKYAKEKGAKAIIRGLRAISDFEYEMQMAQMNNNLYDDIETVFLVPKSKYNFISSSIVKEVSSLGGDINKFVTPVVSEYLTNNINRGEL
ncbi:MAG: pantetheine-phosphate adenylyltransferase [Candidatus Gastranaerophilales bacterium]|nr:pantetheine-phosphate adenylyltransferase [Candidatus Gastranaerophilales bacterium]